MAQPTSVSHQETAHYQTLVQSRCYKPILLIESSLVCLSYDLEAYLINTNRQCRGRRHSPERCWTKCPWPSRSSRSSLIRSSLSLLIIVRAAVSRTSTLSLAPLPSTALRTCHHRRQRTASCQRSQPLQTSTSLVPSASHTSVTSA